MKPNAMLSKEAIAARDARGIIDLNNRPVIQARRWGIPAVEGFLKKLKLNAEARDPFGQGALTAGWADEALENIHTDGWMKEKGEVALAAAQGDKEAQSLMAAAVSIVTTNVVTANTCWMPFFERQTLQPDELLNIVSDTHGQQVTIDGIGQDGGRVTFMSQPDDPTPVFIPIFLRTTPWIEYAIKDLYKGMIKDAALVQFDLARDRAYRNDQLAASHILVGGADTRYTDTFTTTGADKDRDIWAHPGVVLANLPTGNLITLSGNTTTSYVRKELFDAIIEYATSWGENALEAGSFAPVEIIVSSKHKTDFLKQINLGTYGNMLVAQIFETGFVMKYAGYTWIINGVNTIAPTHGVAYVRFDQPIGVWAEKPAMADDIVDESPALLGQNKGRMCSVWAESIAMPRHWRKRTAAFRFRTAS